MRARASTRFDALKDRSQQWVFNAFFSVDSFFFMGGFLVCFGVLGKLETDGVTGYRSFFSWVIP